MPSLSNLTLAYNRSRSVQGHYLNKLLLAGVPDGIYQFHGNRLASSNEEDFKRVFTIYGRGGHLGHMTTMDAGPWVYFKVSQKAIKGTNYFRAKLMIIVIAWLYTF